MNIAEMLLKGLFTEEIEVGKVDEKLCKQLEKLDKDHKAMHAAIRDRIEAFIDQVNKEHKPVCNALKAKTKELWEEVYAAAGIEGEDREKPYTINHETFVLSREELKPGFGSKSNDK